MLNYFPRFLSTRAIICYVVTLTLVSSFFISHALPFQFMLFGLVAVLLFFLCSNKLTMKWQYIPHHLLIKKIFITAFLIRVVYVIFIYFYYIAMTGLPHMYHPGDELLYEEIGALLKAEGFSRFRELLVFYNIEFSDRGYCWWLALENLLLGTHALPYRIVKCAMDAVSCVLMYNLAKRNFGEAAGRITAVFYMMMPNMWYYCGLTLKEIEMVFLVVLFVERGDLALRSPKITLQNIILPGLAALAMFTFRTALAAVMVASLVAALILSSGKQLKAWKKVVYSAVFAAWMLMTVGVEIIQETQDLWNNRNTNQAEGYEWRSNVNEGGNSFAKYASASVFAPLIFTIPFSSMVAVPNQENQMMMNGANFIKNVLSGLTIFAVFLLLLGGKWRQHVLPLALMCGYLVVLVFSNFAHSERFHFPAVPLELMFAAFGVTQLKNKHKRWYNLWLVFVCVANVVWAWIKLAGRGYQI